MAETQLVVFKLAGEQFAAPIHRVREILRPVRVTRMPRTASFVKGLFNLRGQVLPLLDLRLRLGLKNAPVPPSAGSGQAPSAGSGQASKDSKARVVVVEAAGEALGIQVDEVMEVLRCMEEDMQSPQSVLEMPSSRSLASVLDLSGRLVLVLDVDRLLDGAVSDSVEGAAA